MLAEASDVIFLIENRMIIGWAVGDNDKEEKTLPLRKGLVVFLVWDYCPIGLALAQSSPNTTITSI